MCVAGQDHAIPTSSYTYDAAPSLLHILLMKLDGNESKENIDIVCNFPKCNDCEPMSKDVQQVFYRVCGYVVFKLRHSIKCENCYLRLQDNSDSTYSSFRLSAFVDISDYTPGAQIRVSNEVFNILEGAERILWKVKTKLIILGDCLNDKLLTYYNTALEHLPLSTCHNIKSKLVSRFLSMRLKQLSVHLNVAQHSLHNKESSAFASKTMGAGVLVDRFKQKTYLKKD